MTSLHNLSFLKKNHYKKKTNVAHILLDGLIIYCNSQIPCQRRLQLFGRLMDVIGVVRVVAFVNAVNVAAVCAVLMAVIVHLKFFFIFANFMLTFTNENAELRGSDQEWCSLSVKSTLNQPKSLEYKI